MPEVVAGNKNLHHQAGGEEGPEDLFSSALCEGPGEEEDHPDQAETCGENHIVEESRSVPTDRGRQETGQRQEEQHHRHEAEHRVEFEWFQEPASRRANGRIV